MSGVTGRNERERAPPPGKQKKTDERERKKRKETHQRAVNVGDDTTAGDRGLDERVELLVTANGELQVAGGDTLDLEVLGRVARKLEHLGGEVLCFFVVGVVFFVVVVFCRLFVCCGVSESSGRRRRHVAAGSSRRGTGREREEARARSALVRRWRGATAPRGFERKNRAAPLKRTEDGGRVDGGRGADAAVGRDAGLGDWWMWSG